MSESNEPTKIDADAKGVEAAPRDWMLVGSVCIALGAAVALIYAQTARFDRLTARDSLTDAVSDRTPEEPRSAPVVERLRSGHLLKVMSAPELVARLTDHLLRHSTTLGVRMTNVQRVLAQRRILEVHTSLGTARVKVKEMGGEPIDVSPEYEDCRRIARETGQDVRQVMRLVAEAARRELGLA